MQAQHEGAYFITDQEQKQGLHETDGQAQSQHGSW